MSNSALQNIMATRFEAYISAPTPEVWDRIEAQLETDERRRKGIWFWAVDGLAAAAIVTIIIYSVSLSNSSTQLDFTSSNGSNTQEQTDTGKTNQKGSNNSTKGAVTPNLSANKDDEKVSVPRINGEGNRGNTRKERIEDVKEIKLDSEVHNHMTALNESDIHVNQPSLLPLSQVDYALPSKPSMINITNAELKLNSPWEIGVNAINFIQLPSKDYDGTSGWLIAAEPTSDPLPKISSHIRYTELQAYIQKRIKRRTTIGVGISASIAKSSDSKLTTIDSFEVNSVIKYNYWSLGLPVKASFAIIQKGRWSINAGLMVQPEVRFNSFSTAYYSPPPNVGAQFEYLPNSTVESKGNHRSFVVGVQPIIGVDYYAADKMKISASVGYRNYLLRDSYLQSRGIDPNYLTASIGVSWIL